MGYLTAPLAEELCGTGLDTLSLAVIFESLARAAAGPAAVLAFHNCALAALGGHAGRDEARAWLARLAATAESEKPPLAAFAFPETAVDLDRPARPRLESAGEGRFRITGDFLCLPDPAFAERVVLVASGTRPAALIFLDSEALKPHRRNAHAGSGLEECPVARLRLDDFPAAGRAVSEEDGGEDPLDALRLSISALALGTAAEAARAARAYAAERIQTGRPIVQHQEVARMLAEMDTGVEAARSFLYRASATEGAEKTAQARRAHRFCTETAETVCLGAVQTLGGYGYMKDYGIEKRLRDARSLQVLMGSHVEDWLD